MGGRGLKKEEVLRNTPTLKAYQIIPQGTLFAIVSLAARWRFAGGWLTYRTVELSQIQETDMPSFRAADALIYRFFTDRA
jgi:hypothetical protein